MSGVKVDWQVLRGALGVFALALAVALGMALASKVFHERMDRNYQAHFARFRDASRRYLAVDDEARIIAARYPAFRALAARGIIGAEHRLSWVEALRTAGDALDVPILEYRIEAQAPWVPTQPLASDPFEVYTSAMHLGLGLLHEADLARLLEAIERDAEGMFSVERCAFERLAGRVGAEAALQSGQLRAECVLTWFTLDTAARTEEKR
jgi:hypothetical protein